jgi:hypothetical protein
MDISQTLSSVTSELAMMDTGTKWPPWQKQKV